MPFECIWGKLKRKEQIRYLHWIVSCVGLSVLNCHDKQLNSLNNPIWTNVWLTNNSTSILTTINCLFCRNCKNDVFYPRICKHALYESSEWFCHAPHQPANPCLAALDQWPTCQEERFKFSTPNPTPGMASLTYFVCTFVIEVQTAKHYV